MTSLETMMQEKLQKDSDLLQNHVMYTSNYEQAKQFLDGTVFKYIMGSEPNLTDHSITHIQNVLVNAHKLIENNLGEFNALEYYILCMSILFHDVGNYFGREDHETKIGTVLNKENFNYICKQERNIIISIARAHGGNYNILKSLQNRSHLYGSEIKSQEIAAIIRFADELAEGPQRTSQFALDNNFFNKDSKKFHIYAGLTKICIYTNRIAIDYQIDIDDFKSKNELEEMIQFIYKRILKLNNERIACSHYSNLLKKIHCVDASIIFYQGDMTNILIDNEALTRLSISNIDLIDCERDIFNINDKISKILNTIYESKNNSSSMIPKKSIINQLKNWSPW